VFQHTRAIRCPRCGASTPLPEDLRAATFLCAFCHHELTTAEFAGDAAVSADALVAHMEHAIANPMTAAESARSAPKFLGNSAEVRPSNCIDCKAPIDIPMDLTINNVTCAACGRVQATNKHIPQQERFEYDMARQVAGNRALDAFYADGVACTNCGGHLVFPDDGSVQFACPHCKTVLVASQWVDASAVGRRRLKHAVFEMRDELMERQKENDRSTTTIILVVIGLVIAFGVAMQFSGH